MNLFDNLGKDAFLHPTVVAATKRFLAGEQTADFQKRAKDAVTVDGYRTADHAAWRVHYNPAALEKTFKAWSDDDLRAGLDAAVDNAPPYPPGNKPGQSAVWAAWGTEVYGAWQVWAVETQMIRSEIRRRGAR